MEPELISKTPPRLGLAFWGGMSIAEMLRCVELADETGYDCVHTIESFADPFSFLSACAEITSRVHLATGVATVFARTPLALANAAATVDTLSEGRFRLGLGAGHPEIHQAREDLEIARPFPFSRSRRRLRETIEVVRAAVEAAAAGRLVTYEGEIFRITDFEPWFTPLRARFPIYIGSLSEATLELAGEMADGILAIFVRPRDIVTVMASVSRGAEKVPRDLATFDVGAYIPCCVTDDLDSARDAMKWLLATHFSSYRFYRRFFSGTTIPIADDSKVDGTATLAEMAAGVPDDLVDELTIYGSADHCRQRLEQFRAAGVSLPIVYPLHAGFRGYAGVTGAFDEIYNTIRTLAPAR